MAMHEVAEGPVQRDGVKNTTLKRDNDPVVFVFGLEMRRE